VLCCAVLYESDSTHTPVGSTCYLRICVLSTVVCITKSRIITQVYYALARRNTRQLLDVGAHACSHVQLGFKLSVEVGGTWVERPHSVSRTCTVLSLTQL
jgi:hypothetical protein